MNQKKKNYVLMKEYLYYLPTDHRQLSTEVIPYISLDILF